MSFEIQTTSYFESEPKRLAKRHHSFVDDLQYFRDSILKNPYQGTELSPGIRKVRLTIGSKGRGKSGGARVITFTYLVDEKDGVVILLLLYDKADASSIKMNVVRQIIKDLGLDLQQLQSDGKLKAVEIKETEEEIVSSPAVNNQRLAANNDGMTMTK
jgi:mRNA-degrading endonuclease RelE of RelBE toxin-antitoxin system